MKLPDELTEEAMIYYHDHPVEFCEDLIGHVDFDDWQKDALQALRDHHFIAIRSGSGVGKTVLLSLITFWFGSTRPFSKVPTTAPSQHQLNDLLWGEHHKWISRSPFLQSLWIWTQTRVAVKGYEPQWCALARTARVSPDGTVAEGLQGFHAEENLLFIVDEASGVPDAIFPAIEGALTGKKAYAVLAGNPTRLTGYFHSVFNDHSMRGLYRTFHVSCLDSKFVEERYLRMMEARYGKGHPIWQIKVEGEFPTSEINTLVSPEDIERMVNNTPTRKFDKEAMEGGLDVGRTRARSVICMRRGTRILEFAAKALTGGTTDTITVAEWAIEHIRAYDPEYFKVDCVGIGMGVYDILKRIFPKIVKPVIGNVSPADDKKDRYANLRAQGYWELREMIPSLSCKRFPERFITEISDIRYKTPNGKILIESKEDMMKRCGRSPDFADAAMYAFLDGNACIDLRDSVIIVSNLGGVNSEMQKSNFWNQGLYHRAKGKLFPKWDILHR